MEMTSSSRLGRVQLALSLRRVGTIFDDKQVHQCVDLDVCEGEIMTLVGGSGQGKTVLLKEIIGLVKPDTGRIVVYGRDVAQMNELQLQEIRKEVGIVFQGSALFDSLSVRENVAYGVRECFPQTPEEKITEIVVEKLALVDMDGTEELMPSQLSGGMKKRVALARSLALQPRIILYDEPTTGLDPANVRRINALIKKCRDITGITTVMVTHDMHSVRAITDRLALLDGGEIIAVGTWEEMENSSVLRVREFLKGAIES